MPVPRAFAFVLAINVPPVTDEPPVHEPLEPDTVKDPAVSVKVAAPLNAPLNIVMVFEFDKVPVVSVPVPDNVILLAP